MLWAALLILVLVACSSQQTEATGAALPKVFADYPGITNLTYTEQPGDGNVSITLTWQPPLGSGAQLTFYSFTLCRKNVRPCDVYTVNHTEPCSLKVNDLDFWATYTVAGYACYDLGEQSSLSSSSSESVTVRSPPAYTNVATGPGSPRTPPYFSATAINASTAVLSWFDPTGLRKKPTMYIVETCQLDSSCSNSTTRQRGNDTYYKTLQNLKKGTTYKVKLYAVIVDLGENFTSNAAETTFTTNEFEYRPLERLDKTVRPRSREAVDVILTWDAPGGQITPCCYRILTCSGDECTQYEVTSGTKLEIDDQPHFRTFTVKGYACYDVAGNILCSEGTSLNVDTGAGSPKAPAYADARALAPTVAALEWVDPTRGSRKAPDLYSVDLYPCQGSDHQKFTVLYQPNETYSVTAYGLTPRTSYCATITADIAYKGQSYTSTPLHLTVATPASDVLPPDQFEATVGPRKERDTDISFSWKLPEHIHPNLSGYRIQVCDAVDSECSVYKLLGNGTSFTVKSAPYWTNFTVEAYALYEDYGATMESPPASGNVFTGPVAPWVDNFEVTLQGSRDIKVKWDGPHNGHVLGFNVSSCNVETRHCTESTVAANRLDTYQWFFNDLQAWTNYSVSLYAYYKYQNKWLNGTKRETTLQTPPGDPSPVRNATVRISNLTLAHFSWEKPLVARGPLSGYTIACRSTHEEIPLNVSETVEGNVTAATLDLQEQQTDFECNITAFNLASTIKLYGKSTLLRTHTGGIPSPTHLNITRVNATAIALEWDVDPHARNYSVHISSALEGLNVNTSDASDGANETHFYEDDDLKPWTEYSITVQNCGDTYCGKKGILHARTDVAAPSQAQQFSYIVQDYVELTFSWNAPEHRNGPLSGYQINISNWERDEKTTHNIDGTQTSFKTNLTDQYTKYEALLVAFNKDKRHGGVLYGPATVLNITTQGKGPMPPYPDPTKLESDSAVIEWDRPDDKEHAIVLYRVTVADHKGLQVFNATVGVTNVTVNRLHPWSNYTAALESCTDNATCGPVFKEAQFRTDVDAPSVPRSLTAVDVTKDSITLSWEQPSVHNGPIDGYIVQWNNGSTIAVANHTGFKVTELPAGTNCTFQVLAFNKGYTEEKRGPAATLSKDTLPSVATSTIVLAVVLPILVIALFVGGYLGYKKYKVRRSGMSVLENVE